MKSVDVHATLEGALATVDITIVYTNPHKGYPIECTYEIPVDKTTIISSLKIKLGEDGDEVKTEIK